MLLERLPFVKRDEVVGNFVGNLFPFPGSQSGQDIGHGSARFDLVGGGDVFQEIFGIDASSDGREARGLSGGRGQGVFGLVAGGTIELFHQNMSLEIGIELAGRNPWNQNFRVPWNQDGQEGEKRQSFEHSVARVLMQGPGDKEGFRGRVDEKAQGWECLLSAGGL